MAIITDLRAEHIPALYALYRAQTDRLPHTLTTSMERFQADLSRFSEGLIVVEEEGTARGFAALKFLKDDQDVEADAITALFFSDETVGGMLLAECARRARPGTLLAFPQAHGNSPIASYNSGWDGLSDRLPAQARVLVRRGFAPYYRELLLACDLSDVISMPTDLGEIRLTADLSKEGDLLQRAWVGERRIGMCFYSTLVHVADDPRAMRTGYIGWIWTDEEYRRRGIARTLMLRSMAHLQSLGCETCWLGTGADNWLAQPLYLSLGFQIVDGTASFRRDISIR